MSSLQSASVDARWWLADSNSFSSANGFDSLDVLDFVTWVVRPSPGDLHRGLRVDRSEFTVRGAQAAKPFNVAQLYMQLAEGIREAKSVSPDFDVAVKRHQLLDAIQKASDTGIRHIL